MTDANEVGQIVERVVTQVLQGHLPQIREELVRRVLEELPQGAMDAAGHDGSSGTGPADLLRGVAAIHAGGTQKKFSGRCLTALPSIPAAPLCSSLKAAWQPAGRVEASKIMTLLRTSRSIPRADCRNACCTRKRLSAGRSLIWNRDSSIEFGASG